MLDSIEAGISLKGSEVKSMREAKVTLADAFGRLDDSGEMWLLGLHVAPYSHSGQADSHEPDRPRKLLLHRHEIDRWRPRVDQDRLSLIPLSLYLKGGRVKVEMALARGRKSHDKREAIARRDADREAAKAMAARNRGE